MANQRLIWRVTTDIDQALLHGIGRRYRPPVSVADAGL